MSFGELPVGEMFIWEIVLRGTVRRENVRRGTVLEPEYRVFSARFGVFHVSCFHVSIQINQNVFLLTKPARPDTCGHFK